jgi:hypothetical protein
MPAIAEDDFSVLATQGNVKVRKHNTDKWEKLSAGMKLAPGDIVNISVGSYLGLANKNGRTLELKRPGEFLASQLYNSVPDKKSSISSRFTGYVIDQLNQSSNLFSSEDYRSDMKSTGATERSVDPYSYSASQDYKIKSFFPARTSLISPALNLSWFRLPGVSNYTLIVTDRYDRPVFSKTVSDTSVTLAPAEINLSRGDYYFWHVASSLDSNERSANFCFMIYPEDKIKSIRDSLNILSNEIGDVNTAVCQIILAMFFEENGLINDAGKAYREAISREPSVDDFRKLYALFLKKNGI